MINYSKNVFGNKNNWLVVLLSKPSIYLIPLIKNVAFIGVLSFALNYLYLNTELRIPPLTHSLIGFVIGLLLVFRTQSAYERWNTGSQLLYTISSCYVFLISQAPSQSKKSLKNKLDSILINFKNVLEEKGDPNSHNKEEQKLMTALGTSFEGFIVPANQRFLYELMSSINNCIKIRNNPIPFSYKIHIKISIFFYVLSLPFGLVNDMGMYSTFFVMLIFFIVAGVEIISNEIENPFKGDPNDLPLVSHIKHLQELGNTLIQD